MLDQPSLSGKLLVTLRGHFASGRYAAHAAATAPSAFGACTSTNAMCELPSGGSRIVAGPRTSIRHPAGAMNLFPSTVVRGVSAARTSLALAAGVCFNAAELDCKVRSVRTTT